MLRLAIKLGILIAPFLIFFAWAECKLSSMPNEYSKKSYLLEKASTNIEVLILGSSHTAHGVDPFFFHYCGFNMANHFQSLYYDAKILLRWGHCLPKLKLVIFSASYFSLEVNPDQATCRAVFYSRFYNIPPPVRRLWPELRYFSIFTAYGMRSSIDSLLRDLPPEEIADSSTTNTGWMPINHSMPGSDQVVNDENGIARVHQHEATMENIYIKLNISYLREAISWCKSNNVKAVFITTPFYKTYTDHINQKRFALMQDSIHKLCSEYSACYFDFSSDARFTEGDFDDVDHLNSQGARKLSEIVDREVLDPLLKH